MGRQFMRYGFGAIALYIVVAQGTNAGQAFSAGASGVGKVVNAFQGKTVS
jgi:hypothetical protein